MNPSEVLWLCLIGIGCVALWRWSVSMSKEEERILRETKPLPKQKGKKK